jgi:hypothetical protein
MSGGGFFSFGNADPLLLIFLGEVLIALSFSAAAIAVRFRADPGLAVEDSQPHIDLAIGIFAISGLLSILGAILYHNWAAETGNGMMLIIVGTFVLWPLSAFLTLRGRGVGRSVLLVGHSLIATWVSIFLLAILIHS